LFNAADGFHLAESSKDRVVCQFTQQGRVIAEVIIIPPPDFSRMPL
jgi:hypothetical protein